MDAEQMVRCHGYDAHSRWKCQRRATQTITAGCQHEHIGERDLCTWHVVDIDEGRMFCGDCQDSANPHECGLRVIAVRPV